MINKLKIYTAAMLIAGATVTTTTALAVDTKTNVVENISVNLSVYQQYVPGATTYGTAAAGGTNAAGNKLVDHVSTLNTKDIIESLSAATGTNFGNSAKLVLVTTYSNVITSNAPLVTNLSTNISVASAGTNVLTINIGGVSVLTNTIETTNISVTNLELGLGTNAPSTPISTNTIIVAIGGTNVSTNTFATNSGELVVISASPTSGNISNFNVLTEGGTPSNTLSVAYGPSVNVLSGTAKAPVFTDVSRNISGSFSDTVTVQSDKDLVDMNSTNAALEKLYITNLTSESAVGLASFTLRYFTEAATGNGSNLSLRVSGFDKVSLKVDTLYKKGTNSSVVDVFDATATATVAGQGFASGTYLTNAATGSAVSLPVSEYPSTAGTPTNVNGFVTGSLTNTVPIVVEGTISTTFLENLPQ